MKPHYFDQDAPDEDDFLIKIAISQGYVPEKCLLNGQTVMGLVQQNEDPCHGCTAPREKCNGRPYKAKPGAVDPNAYRYDKSKKGCIDNLCLVDFSPDEMSIFIVDLVCNRILFSRTYRDRPEDLFYRALDIALKHESTRIVFDVGGNPVTGALTDKRIKEMNIFPFTAIPKPTQDISKDIPL